MPCRARQGCSGGLAADIVRPLDGDDAAEPHPHHRSVPRSPSEHRSDRAQSRHRLCEACNIKRCRPVWRALASHDPEQALAELRQPKPFGSMLGGIMAEHVALMRNRGYKYTSQPAWFLRFDRFLQLNPALDIIACSGIFLFWWRRSTDGERQSQGGYHAGVLPRADGEPHLRGSRPPLWHRHTASKAVSPEG